MKNFAQHSDKGYSKPIAGIFQKTLIFGERTLMTEFILHAGKTLPLHSHPYEQTGYLIKGHINLKIGSDVYDVQPGDSWCIPMNISHGADICEDSTAIEVFSPRRDDYIPAAER